MRCPLFSSPGSLNKDHNKSTKGWETRTGCDSETNSQFFCLCVRLPECVWGVGGRVWGVGGIPPFFPSPGRSLGNNETGMLSLTLQKKETDNGITLVMPWLSEGGYVCLSL